MAQTGDFRIDIQGILGRSQSDGDDVGSVTSFILTHLETITGVKITQARITLNGFEQNWNNSQTSDRATYENTYGFK